MGGGPVGLMCACMLLANRKSLKDANINAPPIKIMIYDGRWKREKVVWKGKSGGSRKTIDGRSGNNRRRQVVTIQSNVWSEFPQFVKDAMFQEKGLDYAEYWPLGPDSPEQNGFPRNIPVMYIEDKLLSLLQDEDVLEDLDVDPEHRPEIVASKATKEELAPILAGVDHLIWASFSISEAKTLQGCCQRRKAWL